MGKHSSTLDFSFYKVRVTTLNKEFAKPMYKLWTGRYKSEADSGFEVSIPHKHSMNCSIQLQHINIPTPKFWTFSLLHFSIIFFFSAIENRRTDIFISTNVISHSITRSYGRMAVSFMHFLCNLQPLEPRHHPVMFVSMAAIRKITPDFAMQTF